MVNVSVCLGSSCHVRGAKDIVAMLQKAIADNGLENDVELSGSICLGKCSSGGVNMKVNDEIVTGITRESFPQFFTEKILRQVKQ